MKEQAMGSQGGSKLVVQLREDGWYDSSHDDGDWGVEIDPRDQTHVQELISRTSVGSTDLNVGIARMLPGEYHIKHHHPEGSEFYYFISGECIVHVDGDDVRCRPGTAIYLPPNCVHSILNDGDGVVELVYGLSSPEYKDIGLVYDE